MTTTAPDAFVAVQPPGRAGLLQALRGEWTKFWSVRSTAWSLFAFVLLFIGIGALSTHALSTDTFGGEDALRRILVGWFFGQFAVGVLGVMFLSAEYSTGLIRSTLAAMARRPVVVTAKVIVLGAVVLIVSEALVFVTYFIGQLILSGTIHHVALSDPGVLRALVEGGIYLALMSLVGLGLALLLRNTAASIAVFVVAVLIIPLILDAFPTFIVHAVSRYLPLTIGSTIFSATTPERLAGTPIFSPLMGLIILVAARNPQETCMLAGTPTVESAFDGHCRGQFG